MSKSPLLLQRFVNYWLDMDCGLLGCDAVVGCVEMQNVVAHRLRIAALNHQVTLMWLSWALLCGGWGLHDDASVFLEFDTD
jgi:hypothetical protein